MAVIKANSGDVRLLAQLLRAEAEGEGDLGMLMVGNVGVNRVLVDCLDFTDVRNVRIWSFRAREDSSRHRKVISIKGRVSPKSVWPDVSSMGSVPGRLLTRCGSSVRRRMPGNLVQSAEFRAV